MNINLVELWMKSKKHIYAMLIGLGLIMFVTCIFFIMIVYPAVLGGMALIILMYMLGRAFYESFIEH
jgi:hypothetical protein